MHNFIVGLFTEDDYITLLGENERNSKNEKTKILVVPPNTEDPPFVIESVDDGDEIDENPPLNEYNRRELREYLVVS